MKDNILILGGGFIGSALAKRLAEQGKAVTVISRSALECHVPEVDWRQGNLDDTQVLNNLSEYEAIIHAASTSTPSCNILTPSYEVEENLLPLLRLLETMQSHNDIPLLFLSSGGAIYGDPTTLPVPETHVLTPVSNHAAGKASAEHFLDVFARQGHPVTILRPSNIYGPKQPLKPGFGIIRTLFAHTKHNTPVTIWGDGKIVRDYLYIDDLISACLAVLKKPTTGTFNIGSGKGYSIRELCLLAEQITGRALDLSHQPVRSVDVQEIVLDNSAIRRRYSWTPQFTIEQGMRATWEWLQNQP